MIRKIKEKDYDMYNVDGYYIGDKVLFNLAEFASKFIEEAGNI